MDPRSDSLRSTIVVLEEYFLVGIPVLEEEADLLARSDPDPSAAGIAEEEEEEEGCVEENVVLEKKLRRMRLTLPSITLAI